MSYFFQLVVSGIVVGSIYALSALGFVLIYKSSRVLNIAHGQIIAAGAFITYALTVFVGIPIVISFLLPPLVGRPSPTLEWCRSLADPGTVYLIGGVYGRKNNQAIIGGSACAEKGRCQHPPYRMAFEDAPEQGQVVLAPGESNPLS